MTFDHSTVEPKWQRIWNDMNAFQAVESDEDTGKYILGMFPYPSGDLHMGHIRNYTITDAIARYHRLRGNRVLHPFGWDAFGLPAENAAEQRNTNPRDWTDQCIQTMRDDLNRMGFGYDWQREIQTSEPNYYKWNQWLFRKLYEEDLIDYREAAVNWCPSCQTALADAQVEEDNCWRCDTPVVEQQKKQWFIKITEYADELQDAIDDLTGWPTAIKEQQRNWIGRSIGHNITFEAVSAPQDITVFTTRAETIEGVTYVAVSPSHRIASEAAVDGPRQSSETRAGTRTTFTVKNPVTGDDIPVFIASYVEDEVGTGAVMGVPAHDERDFAFASAHDLPVEQVVGEKTPPMTEEAPMTAGEHEGLSAESARAAYAKHHEQITSTESYHLHDWLISRQRYWGTPIPVVHCDDCGPVVLSEDTLPVTLPTYESTRRNPLDEADAWKKTVCPNCGNPATRETDTMDTFVDSSWYFLRYLSPDEESVPVAGTAASSWMPVDEYVGGSEHAVTHLLYARFMSRVLSDIGIIDVEEPFAKLTTQGMVRLDGEKMSKSKGNVVAPTAIVEEFGADTARWFMMSAAAPANAFDWNDNAVSAAHEFLQEIHSTFDETMQTSTQREARPYDRFMKRVVSWAVDEAEEAYEATDLHRIDPIIRRVMGWFGQYTRLDTPREATVRQVARVIVAIIAPIAPHTAEECHAIISDGETPLASKAAWPSISAEPPRMGVVDDFMNDVRSVAEAAEDDQRTLNVTIAPTWKYEVAEIARTTDRNSIVEAVMSNEQFQAHGEAAASYASSLQSGTIPRLSQSEEYSLYEQIKGFVTVRYEGIDAVVVQTSEETPTSSAEPRRPDLSLVA